MSMERVRSRLTDMLVAMERIDGIVSPLNFDGYLASFEKQWLLERGVEIVSEAARHGSQALIEQYPQIRWRDIMQIGNRLRHEYDRVDPFVMWSIATKHLVELKPVIVALLTKLETDLDIR